MKKIFYITIFLLSLNTFAEARECKSGHINGDAFIYSDGKKVKVIKKKELVKDEKITDIEKPKKEEI